MSTTVDTGCPADWHQLATFGPWAEELGFDSICSAEVAHDPFLPLAIAAPHTRRVQLMTSIAVAFARTPMTMATVSWDLHAWTGGRLALGLGSQIKPHITRRFGMPWSEPAARMREFVVALRAIWDSWQNTAPLSVEGRFYQHTLMTPMFDPGPIPAGPPKVLLAAVGTRMTEVAAEVGDGILLHGFTTRRYAEEVTLPALRAAREKVGRTLDDFEIRASPFVVCGTDEASRAADVERVRSQIGFYASTPSYRPVLELHGWGDLGVELTAMTKRGEWDQLGSRIDDEVLDAFAIVAEPADLPAAYVERWAGIADRVSVPNAGLSEDVIAAVIQAVHGAA
ncbi:MAG: TIGR03617 family F420-dependent LLM class oxidoreductase [Ilumatobacteraceae bacterium]